MIQLKYFILHLVVLKVKTALMALKDLKVKKVTKVQQEKMVLV